MDIDSPSLGRVIEMPVPPKNLLSSAAADGMTRFGGFMLGAFIALIAFVVTYNCICCHTHQRRRVNWFSRTNILVYLGLRGRAEEGVARDGDGNENRGDEIGNGGGEDGNVEGGDSNGRVGAREGGGPRPRPLSWVELASRARERRRLDAEVYRQLNQEEMGDNEDARRLHGAGVI